MRFVPSGDILRRVAPLLLLVVDGAIAASLFAWRHAVQAHIEFLTVLRVRELGMVNQHAPAVCLFLARAFEAVLQFFAYDSATLCRKIHTVEYFLC